MDSTKQCFFQNQPRHFGVVFLFHVRYRSQNAMRLGGQANVDALEWFTQELLNKKSPQGSCRQTGVFTLGEDSFGNESGIAPLTDRAVALRPMGSAKQYGVAHPNTLNTMNQNTAERHRALNRPIAKSKSSVMRPPLNSGEIKLLSCSNAEHRGTKFMSWNANGTLNLDCSLGSNTAMTVFQAASSCLRYAKQFAHVGTRKRPTFTVFTKKLVWFGHFDTYGIGPNRQKSIPIVSDALEPLRYYFPMTQHTDPWKHWGLRLKVHLKETDGSLAKLAEKMLKPDGEPMTEGALRHWTNGTRQPNLSDFFELCRLAKADPVHILFGRPLMSAELKTQIGEMASSIFGADPSADPDYAKMNDSLVKATKKRNRSTEVAEKGNVAVATRKPKK